MKTFAATVLLTAFSMSSTLRRLLGFYGTILFVLLFAGSVFATESVPRQVAGILIPPPNGLVDVSDFSNEFRQLAKAGLVPGQIVVGLYLCPSEISLSKGQFRSTNANAFIQLSYSTVELAQKGFRDEMKRVDRDIAVMGFSSNDMKALIEAGAKDVRAIPGATPVDMKGMTYIEKSLPQDRPGYIIALLKASLTVGANNKEGTVVYCCGWQRVKNKIVQFGFLDVCNG